MRYVCLVLVLLLIISVSFYCFSCVDQTVSEQPVQSTVSFETSYLKQNRFECVLVDDKDDCVIFVDLETGVMYLWRKSGYSGGFTLMVDADGNPMIWNFEEP